MALTLAATVVAAEDAFTFVNDGNYSYVQINQDLDSFSFKADWHDFDGRGEKVGYVVYSSDMTAEQRAAYIKENASADNAEFGGKKGSSDVDLGALKAGDLVGFYGVRDGEIYTASIFEFGRWGTKVELDIDGKCACDKDFTIGSITAVPTATPNGAPLPGALAVLLVGGVGAGAFKFGKKKQA